MTGRTPPRSIARLGSAAREHEHLTAAVIAVASFVAYFLSGSHDTQNLNYFTRLADAFLHGRIYLTEAPSWLNELIPGGDGVWYVAYPPMPAILLVPFVAVMGPDAPQQLASAVFGGVAVGLTWLVLGRFGLALAARALLTAVFGFGTVFWYVAEVGSTWYLSHVVAVMFVLAAILLTLDRRWPWLAGLCLGMAVASRLPVALSVPFFLAIVAGLHRPFRLADYRGALEPVVTFLAGVAIPVILYLDYNWLRYGTIVDQSYVLIPGVLDDPIYAKGGIFSPIYIPRNLFAIFFRSWNYVDDPPYLQPSWWGLSIFLTTPLYLWLVKAPWRDLRVAAAGVAVALVLVPILTHGNVGISQFGYRFSLDFQPFLFVILAVTFARGMSRLAVAAGIASIVICAYAVWAIGIGFVAY